VNIQLQLILWVPLKEICRKLKEEFNKVVLSIFGSNIGKDNEVCFPSYKNKKKMQVEK
jgi:hypothetical protein